MNFTTEENVRVSQAGVTKSIESLAWLVGLSYNDFQSAQTGELTRRLSPTQDKFGVELQKFRSRRHHSFPIWHLCWQTPLYLANYLKLAREVAVTCTYRPNIPF